MPVRDADSDAHVMQRMLLRRLSWQRRESVEKRRGRQPRRPGAKPCVTTWSTTSFRCFPPSSPSVLPFAHWHCPSVCMLVLPVGIARCPLTQVPWPSALLPWPVEIALVLALAQYCCLWPLTLLTLASFPSLPLLMPSPSALALALALALCPCPCSSFLPCLYFQLPYLVPLPFLTGTAHSSSLLPRHLAMSFILYSCI